MDTATAIERQACEAALRWHIDEGIAEALREDLSAPLPAAIPEGPGAPPPVSLSAPLPAIRGAADLAAEAARLAETAQTLDELRAAIASFDGVALRRTAISLVFADGRPDARLMVVGDAPGADDDRSGRPFDGETGQLLDRMLAAIGLARQAEDPARAAYLANVINWRPPGNRTPTAAEIEISRPFIARHIALARPAVLLLCGSVAAQCLLNRTESASRLRKTWHGYLPRGAEAAQAIPALVTYHPSLLLATPGHKRAAWEDLLVLQEKMQAMDLTKSQL